MCGLPNNRSFKRKVLLYSRASHLHVQIKKTELDARGGEGSDYGKALTCYLHLFTRDTELIVMPRVRIFEYKPKDLVCFANWHYFLARVNSSIMYAT